VENYFEILTESTKRKRSFLSNLKRTPPRVAISRSLSILILLRDLFCAIRRYINHIRMRCVMPTRLKKQQGSRLRAATSLLCRSLTESSNYFWSFLGGILVLWAHTAPDEQTNWPLILHLVVLAALGVSYYFGLGFFWVLSVGQMNMYWEFQVATSPIGANEKGTLLRLRVRLFQG